MSKKHFKQATFQEFYNFIASGIDNCQHILKMTISHTLIGTTFYHIRVWSQITTSNTAWFEKGKMTTTYQSPTWFHNQDRIWVCCLVELPNHIVYTQVVALPSRWWDRSPFYKEYTDDDIFMTSTLMMLWGPTDKITSAEHLASSDTYFPCVLPDFFIVSFLLLSERNLIRYSNISNRD